MEKAEAEMNRVQKPVEQNDDEVCPECGRNLVIRTRSLWPLYLLLRISRVSLSPFFYE